MDFEKFAEIMEKYNNLPYSRMKKVLLLEMFNGDMEELNEALNEIIPIELLFKNGVSSEMCRGLHPFVVSEVDEIAVNLENNSFLHYLVLENSSDLYTINAKGIYQKEESNNFETLNKHVDWDLETINATVWIKIGDLLHFFCCEGFNLQLEPGVKIEVAFAYFVLNKPVVVSALMVEDFFRVQRNSKQTNATALLTKQTVSRYIPLMAEITKNEYEVVVTIPPDLNIVYNCDVFFKINRLLNNDGFQLKHEKQSNDLVDKMFELNEKQKDVETYIRKKYVKYVPAENELNIRKRLFSVLRRINTLM